MMYSSVAMYFHSESLPFKQFTMQDFCPIVAISYIYIYTYPMHGTPFRFEYKCFGPLVGGCFNSNNLNPFGARLPSSKGNTTEATAVPVLLGKLVASKAVSTGHDDFPALPVWQLAIFFAMFQSRWKVSILPYFFNVIGLFYFQNICIQYICDGHLCVNIRYYVYIYIYIYLCANMYVKVHIIYKHILYILICNPKIWSPGETRRSIPTLSWKIEDPIS